MERQLLDEVGGGSEKDECVLAARRKGTSTRTGEKAPEADGRASACEDEDTLTKVTGSPETWGSVEVGPCGAPGAVGKITASAARLKKPKN